MSVGELKDIVSKRLGRDCETVFIQGKGHRVLYINFSSPPPPLGKDEREALENFISWFDELQATSELAAKLP
jgi:hypothetical protein